jgi:hypothetical protein
VTRRRFDRPWKSPGIMSRRLTPTSSIDEPVMSSIDGNDFSWTSTSTMRSSSLPSRSCSRIRWRVPPISSRTRPGSSSGAVGRGGNHKSSSRSSVVSSAFAFTSSMRSSRNHVHGELDKVAHHRLDVAADLADLGELRRFDLDEGRMCRLARRRAISVLPHAGRPDHQDVLRRNIFREIGRQLLAAHAIAERDRDGPASPWPGRRHTCRARRRFLLGVSESIPVLVRSGNEIGHQVSSMVRLALV